MYVVIFFFKLGYFKCVYFMNVMVFGLFGGKMFVFDLKFKIDFFDIVVDIKSKIKVVFCFFGEVENNGVIVFIKIVFIFI